MKKDGILNKYLSALKTTTALHHYLMAKADNFGGPKMPVGTD